MFELLPPIGEKGTAPPYRKKGRIVCYNDAVNRNILIIEDDQPILRFLSDALKEEGFVVDAVSSGSQGLGAIKSHLPDLVILDLGLPDISGETVLKKIRTDFPELPVIILTAKVGVANIVEGLHLGADDYIEKPFDAQELLARIRARLRSHKKNPGRLQCADLLVDLESREVKRGGKDIPLTKTEFDLLVYLLMNRGKVLTREMMLNHVWGYTAEIESRVVDVYIGYLRRKIERGSSKKIIRNKRGVGYLIEA